MANGVSAELGTSNLESVTTPDDPDKDILAELCDETLTPEERLENQLALSERWTIEDDLIESRILNIRRKPPENTDYTDDNAIYLSYWLPSENVAVEKFDKPIPWSPEDYKFARVVEALGYNHTSLDQIEGAKIALRRKQNEWQVADPEDEEIDPTRYDSSTNSLSTGSAKRPQFKKSAKKLAIQAWQHPTASSGTGALSGIFVGATTIWIGTHAVAFVFSALNRTLTEFQTLTQEEPDTVIEQVLHTQIDLIIGLLPLMVLLQLIVFFVRGTNGGSR